MYRSSVRNIFCPFHRQWNHIIESSIRDNLYFKSFCNGSMIIRRSASYANEAKTNLVRRVHGPATSDPKDSSSYLVVSILGPPNAGTICLELKYFTATITSFYLKFQMNQPSFCTNTCIGKSTLFNRLLCKQSNRAYRLSSEKEIRRPQRSRVRILHASDFYVGSLRF